MAQMSHLNQLGRVMKRRRRVKPAEFCTFGDARNGTGVNVWGVPLCLPSPCVTVPFSAFALSDTCVPSVQSVVLVYQVSFGSVEGVKVLADNFRGRLFKKYKYIFVGLLKILNMTFGTEYWSWRLPFDEVNLLGKNILL
ncbi:hypothetical protein EV2_017726 [Malus domestica]